MNNLHLGIDDVRILADDVTVEDIAAAGQQLCEEMVLSVMRRAKYKLGKSKNLVYMGGVALNCVINRRLGEIFDKIWIMPNPGDAGSSLGCGRIQVTEETLHFTTPFLGY